MSYLERIRRHYDGILRFGTDCYGVDRSGLWLASIDLKNGGQPARPFPAKKRVYREITAPRGSNLYWEQPAVVCAYHLSHLTGDSRYRHGADLYLRDFLKRCVSKDNGLFLWGNHLYYDVFTDAVVGFSGGYHEARPLPCAWDLFWAVAPEATEQQIRTMGRQHIKNKDGFFDRHADVSATTDAFLDENKAAGIYPFLEAGGILVESLCWLAAKKNGDQALVERALRCARYSFRHKNEETGLLRNQPLIRRWDYDCSTTEVGLWAGCLLRAAKWSGQEEFSHMARGVVSAWLRYGYEEQTGFFFGKLRVADGQPVPELSSEYEPGRYADLWEPLFPTHNYPMPMAEACLSLWEQTQNDLFRQAVARWAAFIGKSMPANQGRGAYADQYGRCVHFLCRAAQLTGDHSLRERAILLANEAIAQLYLPDAEMFRGHPGEDRCDAVDGVGILFLALLFLETGADPDLMGFHF